MFIAITEKKEKDAPTSPASKIDEIISFLRPQSTLGDTSKSRKAHLNPGLSNDTQVSLYAILILFNSQQKETIR